MQAPVQPLIGIAGNFRELDGHAMHAAGRNYVHAVATVSGGFPVILPGLGDAVALDVLLDRLDGLVLTGGVSNVEPRHYGGPPSREGVPHEPGRDGLVLRLVRAAVDRGLPVLGICRGLQEMNVAYGGSLHAHLHEVPGRMDHRRPRVKPHEQQLAPRHRIEIVGDGLLGDAIGCCDALVNSLHGQGVDRLGGGLVVDAWTCDGTVEALHVDGAPGFALGVQWHCEYQADLYPVHTRIFDAFGAAARAYAAKR
jgi:putative glutamine amidotransferase